MFKNISISKKIHIPVVLSIVIGLLIAVIVLIRSMDNINKNVKTTQKNSMELILNLKYEKKFAIGLTNAINLSFNKSIINGLKENNRTIIINDLKDLSKAFRENSTFKNIKIHVHTADVHSFIRLWNLKKYGDDLSSFRETINEVKRIKKALKSFEIGRAGLVLRGIAPIIDNKKYLGSVEFIQGLNSVSRTLEKQGLHYITVMDEKYLDIATKLKTAKTLFSHYKLVTKKGAIMSIL